MEEKEFLIAWLVGERVKNFNTQRNKSAAGPVLYERKQVSSRKQMRKDRSAFRETTARRFSGKRGLKIGGFRETIRLFNGSRCANRRLNSASAKQTCAWTHYVTYT